MMSEKMSVSSDCCSSAGYLAGGSCWEENIHLHWHYSIWAFLSKDTSLNRATTLCTYTSEMWRPRFDISRSSLERFHCIRVLYDYHKQRATGSSFIRKMLNVLRLSTLK